MLTPALLHALGGFHKVDDQLIFTRIQGLNYASIYSLWSEIRKTKTDYVEKGFPRKRLITIVSYQYEGEDYESVLSWSFHHTKRQARNFVSKQEQFTEETFIRC
jgi:hypothetical protein